jgi:hypothetical protein
LWLEGTWKRKKKNSVEHTYDYSYVCSVVDVYSKKRIPEAQTTRLHASFGGFFGLVVWEPLGVVVVVWQPVVVVVVVWDRLVVVVVVWASLVVVVVVWDPLGVVVVVWAAFGIVVVVWASLVVLGRRSGLW